MSAELMVFTGVLVKFFRGTIPKWSSRIIEVSSQQYMAVLPAVLSIGTIHTIRMPALVHRELHLKHIWRTLDTATEAESLAQHSGVNGSSRQAVRVCLYSSFQREHKFSANCFVLTGLH